MRASCAGSAHLRSRGLAAKLHLALDRLPQFAGLDAAALRGAPAGRALAATISSAPTITRSTASSRRPRSSRSRVPTLNDPSLAPARPARLSADRAIRALCARRRAGTAERAALHRRASSIRWSASHRGCARSIVAARAARPRRISSANFASAAATGITATLPSTSSSWCARCRARRSTHAGARAVPVRSRLPSGRRSHGHSPAAMPRGRSCRGGLASC